ncbi:MAG: hypothetical protein ABI144_07010 [Gallionella sp.]
MSAINLTIPQEFDMSNKIVIVAGGSRDLVRENKQLNSCIAGQTALVRAGCLMISTVSCFTVVDRQSLAIRNGSEHPMECSFNKFLR